MIESIATSDPARLHIGQKGTAKYVVADLIEGHRRFVEHCLNNPNDKALQAFTGLPVSDAVEEFE